MYRNTDMVA